MKTTEHLIWNPETGITDLEGNPSELSASEIPGIKAVWTDQQERLKDSSQLSDFTEKLNREWVIETGAINGGLICAPFLEFKDTDGEGEERLTFVPIADEGFVFFYNEKKKKLLSRFTSWREDMIKIALKNLARNL